MSSKGGRKRLRNGLTPKETAFKNEVIRQIVKDGDVNGTQAALKTYDTTDYRVAADIGSKNLKKPQIEDAIEKTLRDKGMTLDHVVENLQILADSPVAYVTSAVKLKTNLELFKALTGNLSKRGKTNITINQQINNISYSEAKKRIESLNQEATDIMQDAEN